MSDSEIVRKIAGGIFDSFAETPQWTRAGWARKLSPYILEGISEVRKPLVDALAEALVPIAVLKLTDSEKPYAEISPELRASLLKAHGVIMSALAKVNTPI